MLSLINMNNGTVFSLCRKGLTPGDQNEGKKEYGRNVSQTVSVHGFSLFRAIEYFFDVS